MDNLFVTILATIVVLGPIVFIHELGHFLAAKFSGVKVHRFSLGFPPTIFKKKVGETEYALGAIFFGGYVKMEGENPQEETEPSPRSLNSKPIGIRAIIMAAGSFMNIIFAIFLLWFIIAFHGMGEVSELPVIGQVVEDSPADSAGLMDNDMVLSIDGQRVSRWEDMSDIVHVNAGKKMQFEIERGDSVFVSSIVPAMQQVQTDTGMANYGLIGIAPSVQYQASGVFRAVPETFVLMGDIIKSVGLFVKKIFTSGLNKSDVGGPVMIAAMAGASARAGWAALLFFMAALSINLGILNLFPFPVLDGGHLVFLLIEAIRKKPLSIKVRLIAQQIGVLFILALMVYVTINDLFTVFG